MGTKLAAVRLESPGLMDTPMWFQKPLWEKQTTVPKEREETESGRRRSESYGAT